VFTHTPRLLLIAHGKIEPTVLGKSSERCPVLGEIIRDPDSEPCGREEWIESGQKDDHRGMVVVEPRRQRIRADHDPAHILMITNITVKGVD